MTAVEFFGRMSGRPSSSSQNWCCCWSSCSIGVAYVLLADRKIWVAVQIGAWPNVVGAAGVDSPSPTCLKFVLRSR